MSQRVVDASLTLQWYLKDEEDRDYALAVLAGLRQSTAVVPFLWTYEISNGLVMAHRRRRIATEQISAILDNLVALPITIDRPEPESVMKLPSLALEGTRAYDAAYLELAFRDRKAGQGRTARAFHSIDEKSDEDSELGWGFSRADPLVRSHAPVGCSPIAHCGLHV